MTLDEVSAEKHYSYPSCPTQTSLNTTPFPISYLLYYFHIPRVSNNIRQNNDDNFISDGRNNIARIIIFENPTRVENVQTSKQVLESYQA